MANLHVLDFPVAQPRPGRIAQPGHGGRAGRIRLREFARCFISQPVFLLRGRQLGAVDGQQGLTGAHPHAGLIGIEALHPSLEAWGDRVLSGFVNLDGAAGAHLDHQGAASDRFRAHPQRLDAVWGHHHGARRGGRSLAGIHRHIVHPHGILLGNRRGVRQPHRIAVVEDLALGGRCRSPTLRWIRRAGAARNEADGHRCQRGGDRQ